MGKSLIITEKPSVAREFARILGVSGRNDGYIEDSHYAITWCVGHLVEMVYPEEYDIKYKKWKLEDLPFLPKDYKYNVIPSVSKQYDIVHKLLHREDIDTVYWAGDAGKEGQTIEENIRRFGGVREGMKELRVWIDSQTEEEIKRGIAEARPMSDYDNLANSGIMRTIEDYAMGINFSRVMSVKYGNLLNDAAGTKSYTAIAVGRVMTCVLGMVVIREREIRNFVETPFYRVVGNFFDAEIEGEWKAVEGSSYYASPLLYKENGFKEKVHAEKLIKDLTNKTAIVKTVDKGISKKRAPLLFNLAELQAECSKRFKISPDETLQVAQDLYERKLTTYPRTDARVLSSAVAKEISKNIRGLRSFEPVAPFVQNIVEHGLYKNIGKSSYTDDSKITDHYAIVPTGQVNEYKSLTELQKRVYELIVRRFLSIFYPPAQYQTVKLTIGIEKESFFAGAKVLKVPGYLEIAGRPDTKEKREKEDGDGEENNPKNSAALLKLADSLKEGDTAEVKEFLVKEGKTSPPKRYTSGSMVLAMENAGQLIEEEELREQIKGSGIGTSATRAEIIKKLVRIGYLALNKKTQVLTPEALGEMVYEVVNMTVPALLNPKMTASWEKGLDGITQGTVPMEDYREKLEEFIRKETVSMINENLTSQIAGQIRPLAGSNAKDMKAKVKIGATCPVCGGEIETTPFGYGCSNYNKDGSGCRFAIGAIAGRELNDEEVRQLLSEGRTGVLKGFTSKNKKKFSACLVMTKDEEGKPNITFDFSQNEPETIEGVSCPLCGGAIEIKPFGYGCANYNKDDAEHSCRFMIGKIGGVKLNDSQVRQLLATKKTDVITGFTSKTGKKFDAPLKLNTEGQIVFDFPDRPQPVETSLTCPRCKEHRLKKGQWYYECECGFRIGHTVAQVPLSEEIMQQLFTEGRTRDKVTGFVSKAGNSFDAVLKYEDERIQFDFDARPSSDQKDAAAPMPWTEEPAVPPTSDNQPVEASGEAFPVEFPPDDSSEESMSFADEQSLFADSEEDGLPWN